VAVTDPEARARELRHHEALYSGFAQQHFARPAVKAFRRHLADRIVKLPGASSASRLLSLGCGIGDTELLLAPHVASLVGVDVSPSAVKQARLDAARAGLPNVQFLEGDLHSQPFPEASFDVIVAVFLLHHLREEELRRFVPRIKALLSPGGCFYSLDPNRYRLAGAIGKLVAPSLMRKYRSPDERELAPTPVLRLFEAVGLEACVGMYDFVSTPLAGLYPSAKALYRLARWADDLLVRLPLVRSIGSNFELLARKL